MYAGPILATEWGPIHADPRLAPEWSPRMATHWCPRQFSDWTHQQTVPRLSPERPQTGAWPRLAPDRPPSGAPSGQSASLGQCDLGFGLCDLGFKVMVTAVAVGLVRDGDLRHLFMTRTRLAHIKKKAGIATGPFL